MPDDDALDVEQGTGQPPDFDPLAQAQQPLEGGGMPMPPMGVPPGATPQQMPQFPPPQTMTRMPMAQPMAQPTLSQQAQRHGGLLTGLTGVLLDGLGAGMRAQANAPLYGAPGSLFAQGLVNAQPGNIALYKQQQQQQMWDSLSKVEQDKALMAQSYMNQKQYHMMSMQLDDALVGNMTLDDVNTVKTGLEQGWATRMATMSGADARKQATDMQHDLMMKDPNFQGQYWAMPYTHDADGKVKDWQVVKVDPNATLSKDTPINYPYLDPATGQWEIGTLMGHAGMNVKDFFATRESMRKNGVSNLATKEAERLQDTGTYYDAATGRTIEGTRQEAIGKGQVASFTKWTEPQKKDAMARQGVLNDAQLNVSRYFQAANKYATTNVLTRDGVPDPSLTKFGDSANMRTYLDKAGLFDLKVQIGPGGEIDIPGISTAMESLSRGARAEAYGVLSDQAKDMLDGYQRTRGAMLGYMRALASQRFTKEQMDIELQQVLTPDFHPQDVARRLNEFNENIQMVEKSIPLPTGMPTTSQIRKQFEDMTGQPALTGAPTKGDSRIYQNYTYTFDGTQWVRQGRMQ